MTAKPTTPIGDQSRLRVQPTVAVGITVAVV